MLIIIKYLDVIAVLKFSKGTIWFVFVLRGDCKKDGFKTAFLAENPAVADLEERVRMQPTATASIPPPADMDLQTMQSMDWLFKKERIYLLAQFWQQVSNPLSIYIKV